MSRTSSTLSNQGEQQQQQSMMTEEPKDPKLNFQIVSCSGEDESFPVSQLVRHTSSTRGWHSMQACEYPQEIVLRFSGEVRISMIKILAHETKIPSRIDLAVCRPDRDHQQSRSFPPLQHATFHRLGYLTFTNNEASAFESRELKTAQINTRAIYLKLTLRRCHPNVSNVFNQVGIVALGIYGEVVNEYEPPANGNSDAAYGEHLPGSVRESLQLRHFQEQHQLSQNQNQRHSRQLKQSQRQDDDEIPLTQLQATNFGGGTGGGGGTSTKPLPEDGKLDPRVASKIAELSVKKTKAVDGDDFDEAKRLKILIDRLRDSAVTLADLEERKRRAVASEDYDVAKVLKLQIDDAKAQVDNEVMMSGGASSSLNLAQKQQQVQFASSDVEDSNNNSNSNNIYLHRHYSSNNHITTLKPSQVHQQRAHHQHQQPQQNTAFEELPAGVGARQHPNVQQEFDERPVGGGGGGGVVEGGGRNRGIPFEDQSVGGKNSVPSPKQQTTKQPQPSNASDSSEPLPPPSPAPHGLNQEFAATEYDEKPAVSSVSNRIGNINSETGGIVVKQQPSSAALENAGPVEIASSEWEKAVRAMIQSELASDVHEPDALPGPSLPAELVAHATQFGRYATACLISKKFQHREAAIRVLGSDAGASLLRAKAQKQPAQVISQLITYFAERGRGVDDGISQVFFAVCDALKTIITGGINCGGDGVTAYDVAQGVSALVPGLLLKAGDSNQRVREHASATLMLIAMSPIGPEKIASALLHDPQVDSKKPLNFRVQSARLSLATVMVNKLGLSTRAKPTGLTPEGLTSQLCIPQLSHSNSEVREGAVHLIILLYGLVKPQSKMDALLVDVKPAQKALIDEQLAAVKDDNDTSSKQQQQQQQLQQQQNDDDEVEELKSTSISVARPNGSKNINDGASKALAAAREAAKERREELWREQQQQQQQQQSGGKKQPPAVVPGSKKSVVAPSTPRANSKTKTPAPVSPGKSSTSNKAPGNNGKAIPVPTPSVSGKKAAPNASPAKTGAAATPPSPTATKLPVGTVSPKTVPNNAKKTSGPKNDKSSAPPLPLPLPPLLPGAGPGAAEEADDQEDQKEEDDEDDDDPHTCQFCHRHDDRYDETSLDRHYLRSCPMLCACPLCGQICEISQLQDHLTTECAKSSLVRACPNCHEAVRASDLDSHIAEASCIKHNPTKYNVCPLCHAKTAPFDEGWKQHFASAPGCPNNPRAFNGGDVEEDFKD